jgi:hypothetical protein
MNFSSSNIIFFLLGGGGGGNLPSAMAIATIPPLETNKHTKNDPVEEVVGTDLLGILSSGGGGGEGIVATSTLENYDFENLKGQVSDPSELIILCARFSSRRCYSCSSVSPLFFIFPAQEPVSYSLLPLRLTSLSLSLFLPTTASKPRLEITHCQVAQHK